MNKKTIAIGIAVFVACLVLIPSVSADWLSGWDYRKTINITGQSGAGTYYQVNLSIGNSSGGDFHLEGHCTDFPNDIVVTDDDSTTKIPFWIENTSTDPIQMWVNVTDNLNSTQDVCIYYGKTDESSASNGTNTFEFFDDFEDDTIGGWTEVGTGLIEGSGVLKSNALGGDGGNGEFKIGGYRGNTALQNYVFEGNVKWTNDWGTIIIRRSDNSNFYQFWKNGDTIQFTKIIAGARTDITSGAQTLALNTQYTFKIIVNGTSFKYYHNGVTLLINTTDSDIASGNTGIGGYSDATNRNVIVDDIRVRKYASPEPAYSSAGSEETAGPDAIPPTPTNLQNTTGNFWVNYTWAAGSGNVTNGYKVTWNSSWYNTSNDYMNKSVGASNWANITVWAWNSSGNGTISAGSVSDQIKMSSEPPCTTPTISSLTNTSPGAHNVTITWTTNQSADNIVKYSKNSDLSDSSWSNYDNDTTSISIDISPLDSETPYYYQAWSYNGTNATCYITEPTSSPYKTFTTTSSPWCNANYGKKVPILINNTAGSELIYYQIMLNYTYDSDMNADFSDARVYNENGCSLVPLWNESAVSSSWNQIWFNASSIPTSSWCNDTYYLYYDNSEATTVSSGETTFEFFDDFESSTFEDWYLEQEEPYLWKGSSGFDVSGVEQPYLYYNESDALYYLFYEACDGTSGYKYKIGVATSSNATGPFTRSGSNPIVDPIGKEGESGNSGTQGPSVIKVGDMYYMFLGHQDSDGNWDYIRRYNSTNLTDWTNNGTALSPSVGEWDSGACCAPTVIYDPNIEKYIMVYEGWIGTTFQFQTGLATATNITDTFTKSANNPIVDHNESAGRGHPNGPSIIKNNSEYSVFWDNRLAGSTGICYSTSTDLVNWTHTNEPIYSPTGTPTQTSPLIFNDSGTQYLFHQRQNASDSLFEISIAFEGETEIISANKSNWTTNIGSPTTASGLGGTPYSLRFPTSSSNDYTTSSNFPQEYSNCTIDASFSINQHFVELRFGLQSENLYTGNRWTVHPDVGNAYITISQSGEIIDQVAWAGVLDTEYTISIVKNGSYVTTYINGVKYNNNFDLGVYDYNVGKTCLGSYGQGNFDDVRIRKYTSPEPTAQLGNEEGSPSTDTSFTVTLPVGYSYAHFQPPNSTAKNYSCNGQNLTTSIYNVTNTGNVNLDIRMKLNATITNIILRADTDNNPSGSSIIQTTLVTISGGLAHGSSIDIWLWSDFNHTIEQSTNRTLDINVTE